MDLDPTFLGFSISFWVNCGTLYNYLYLYTFKLKNLNQIKQLEQLKKTNFFSRYSISRLNFSHRVKKEEKTRLDPGSESMIFYGPRCNQTIWIRREQLRMWEWEEYNCVLLYLWSCCTWCSNRLSWSSRVFTSSTSLVTLLWVDRSRAVIIDWSVGLLYSWNQCCGAIDT